MYYESIIHQLREVANSLEAATLIKNGKLFGYEALKWTSPNGIFYAVNDAHIDDSTFGETAVIKEVNGQFIQVESITAAWIKTPEELAKSFEDAEINDFSISKASLIIGEVKNQTAFFTCGCCGERFHDLVKKQLQFNQDAGYGICSNCSKYY